MISASPSPRLAVAQPLRSLLGGGDPDLVALTPLLAFGFRPFFLLAALAGALFPAVWMFVLAGRVAPPAGLAPTVWHGHEMLFGFAGAVLAGFLLTATRNWTRLPTAHGRPLAALVLLFVACRLLAAWGGGVLALALADAAFLPVVGLVALRPILRARSHRNLVFVALLFILGGADAITHLAGHGVLGAPAASRALLVASDAVLLAIVVLGGRVVPPFSANALGPTVVTRRDHGAVDRAGLAAMWCVTLADAAGLTGGPLAAVLLAAGALHAARMRGWGSWAARRNPLLGVLHAGWLLVAVGLVTRALAEIGAPVPRTTALHVLTIGGIGLIALGMMARVALGHTGRPLVASRGIVAAFVLLALALPARVLPAVLAPDNAAAVRGGLHAATALWSAAFVLFLLRYAPVLTAARADGKPG